MRPEETDRLRRAYCRDYNRSRSELVALQSGIVASVRRNPLYASGVHRRLRITVLNRWRELLRGSIDDPATWTDEGYERSLVQLRAIMNAEFGSLFERATAPTGFRISHAQKSLSVYMKHLWCIGLADMPPACPVDRVVLSRAGIHSFPGGWTGVDCADVHHGLLVHLRNEANSHDMQLAEWELWAFSS